MHPPYWNAAKKHLSAQCPTMKALIARYEGETLRARGDGFFTLVRSVVGQQISVKAADAVWAKVAAVVTPMTPTQWLATPDEKLRACGLSASKVAYARNVAVFFVERGIGINAPSPKKCEGHFLTSPQGRGNAAVSLCRSGEAGDTSLSGRGQNRPLAILGEGDYWAQFTDAEVIAELTAIKGIGVWTAEMFLIFHLLRPDVFPVKDLGVLKSIHLHLVPPAKLKQEKWLKPEEYQKIATRWQPYRTVATWYLWRALDPVPVAY